ncbi:MAG: vitamin B12-dependent ribonucleotide reductase, partial [Planctomycetota bacterium]
PVAAVRVAAPSKPAIESASESIRNEAIRNESIRNESIRTESIRTEARFVSHDDKSPSWAISSTAAREDSRGEQFSRFQSDAPACDNCGSVTVRNGNCYLCHNCGNSLGCS